MFFFVFTKPYIPDKWYMDPTKNEYLKINSIHVLFKEINNLRFCAFMDLINFFPPLFFSFCVRI